MDSYNYDEYFNQSYGIEDFFNIVASLVPDVEYYVDEPVVIVEVVEVQKPVFKKAKKTYAAQMQELKNEILNLRQEVEVRDAQLLALIYSKSN